MPSSMRLNLLGVICLATLCVHLPRSAAAQAARDYRATVLEDQPVGYWRLGEQPGTAQAQDSSGNGYHGTYRTRTPPSWPPQLGMAGAIAGDSDTAARFFWYNNPNVTPITQWNWVEIPFNANNASLIQPQGAFTLEAWFTTPIAAQQTYSGIISTTTNDGRTGYGLIAYLHQLWFYVGNRSTRVGFPFSLLTPNQFHHIVATWNGQTATIYLNGARVAWQNLGFVNPSSGPLLIGKEWLGSWNGMIDEVAVYHRALDQERVLAHYQAAQTPVASRFAGPSVAVPVAPNAETGSIFNCDPRMRADPGTEDNWQNLSYLPPSVPPARPDCPTTISWCDANGNPLPSGYTAAQLNQQPPPEASCPATGGLAAKDCPVDLNTLTTPCTLNAQCAAGEVCASVCLNNSCTSTEKRCGRFLASCAGLEEDSECEQLYQCAHPSVSGTLTPDQVGFPSYSAPQPTASLPPTEMLQLDPHTPLSSDYCASDVEKQRWRETFQTVLATKNQQQAWGFFAGAHLDERSRVNAKRLFGKMEFEVGGSIGFEAGAYVMHHKITALTAAVAVSASQCRIRLGIDVNLFGDNIAVVDYRGVRGTLAPIVNDPLLPPPPSTDQCNQAFDRRNDAAGALRQSYWVARHVLRQYPKSGSNRELCFEANSHLGKSYDCDNIDPVRDVGIMNAWIEEYNAKREAFMQAEAGFNAEADRIQASGRIPLFQLRRRYTMFAASASIPIWFFKVDLAAEAYGEWGVQGELQAGVVYNGGLTDFLTPPVMPSPTGQRDVHAAAGPIFTPFIGLHAVAYAGVGIPGVSVGIEATLP
jgi:hypothetical protein